MLNGLSISNKLKIPKSLGPSSAFPKKSAGSNLFALFKLAPPPIKPAASLVSPLILISGLINPPALSPLPFVPNDKSIPFPKASKNLPIGFVLAKP